ncbi:GYD domain-containing protein [Aestuariivirga sp.]|uniref:GYD domain-containing protein n=1 Tax=Aestuariivirga sp. TaxID=2650926 RepID=UPI00391A2101
MPKIMWSGSYTPQGTKGVIAEGGSGRRAAVEKMLGSLGGKLECMYFAFGSDDVVLIAELPDNVSAAAVGLTVGAAGSAQGRMTVLLTPEEIDQAAKKSPEYRPPGR